MPISRSGVAAGAIAAALLAAAWPALGQQDSPTSILPPGFDQPAPAATPAPRASSDRPAAVPRPAAQPTAASPDVSSLGAGAPASGLPTPNATPTPSAPPDPLALSRYVTPDFARRSLGAVGPISGNGALAGDAWGNVDGVFLEQLMRRVHAPLLSRWMEIGLRNALLSRAQTPSRINGADFAAERAWLLVRMGEAPAARAMVQSVDPEDYTPKLYQIAMQAALASGDAGALCPLVEGAQTADPENAWIVAKAICTGLAGLPRRAQPLLIQAQRANAVSGIDFQLAQKVTNAGGSGGQDVTVVWDGVSRLTPWRYGMAMAGRVPIPAAMYDGLSPAVQFWLATAPGVASQLRAEAAERAAIAGVLSSDALVDLFAGIPEDADNALAPLGIARDLGQATAGGDLPTRLRSLASLWNEPTTMDGRYARLILTARAASRIPVGAENADADRLIESMLSAGLDLPALRWQGRVAAGGQAWALLTVADPRGGLLSYGTVGDYAPASDADNRRKQMFFAALAGLGRLTPADIERGAQAMDVRVGAENSWTRALNRAALERQPATVLLLSAVGMQTPSWRGVSPEALYHILAALRAAGLEGNARMVAAEALTRL